jgi:hypothetical protein
VAATVILGLASQAGAAALASPGPLPVTGRGVAGLAAGVLLALYLRIADDLKDWETDRELAAAGDLRFATRPQVTGGVAPGDLRRASAAVAAAFGLLLAPQPRAAVLLGGLSFLGAWLSARWFFFPAMATRLPLAFATHNPLALLFLAFAAAVGWGATGAAPPAGATVALLLGLYLPVAAWEISRKVRMPAEETAYATWSALLGWRAAAVLPALLTTGSAISLALAARAARFAPAGLALLAVFAALPAAAAVRLLARPGPERARHLRPAVELYTVGAGAGLVVAALVARGVGGLPRLSLLP